MSRSTEDLAAARRLLFVLSEGLVKVAGLLTAAGLADEGRTAAGMGTDVVAMRRRVRKAHNAAIAAESTMGETR